MGMFHPMGDVFCCKVSGLTLCCVRVFLFKRRKLQQISCREYIVQNGP